MSLQGENFGGEVTSSGSPQPVLVPSHFFNCGGGPNTIGDRGRKS